MTDDDIKFAIVISKAEAEIGEVSAPFISNTYISMANRRTAEVAVRGRQQSCGRVTRSTTQLGLAVEQNCGKYPIELVELKITKY